MNNSVVIMGVAGCGKSSLGHAVAQAVRLPLVEGGDFHSPQSRQKMSQGVALTDTDRAGWLDRLCEQLRQHPGGVVLTCSALKKPTATGCARLDPGCVLPFWRSTVGKRKRALAHAARPIFSPAIWSTANLPPCRCLLASPASWRWMPRRR